MSSQHAHGRPAIPAGHDTHAVLVLLANDVVDTARSVGRQDVPEPHLGADLATSADREAQQLRTAGASFDWVAFTRPGTPMWDEHVGVVHVGDQEYAVGIHLADRLAGAEHRIDELARILGATPSHSRSSREHQVVVRRLHLPDQHDEAVRLSLDLFQHVSRRAG